MASDPCGLKWSTYKKGIHFLKQQAELSWCIVKLKSCGKSIKKFFKRKKGVHVAGEMVQQIRVLTDSSSEDPSLVWVAILRVSQQPSLQSQDPHVLHSMDAYMHVESINSQAYIHAHTYTHTHMHQYIFFKMHTKHRIE